MSLSFDAIAEQFDGQRGLPVAALRRLVAFIERRGGGRSLAIIEPGIGTGRITLPLAAAGHRITGVDVSWPMLDTCRAKAEALRVGDRVELILDDATSLPCDDDVFDAGIFASLLYLVPEWERALDELARVVRPDGLVICIRERTDWGDALRVWDAAWRERVEAAGYSHTSASPTDEEMIAAMIRRWDDLTVEPLASWVFGQSVGEGRQDYGDRLRWLYPGIPDAGWDALVDDFLSWSEEAMPDSATRLDVTVVLEAVVARI